MPLEGAPELKARLKSLRLAFKPVGRDWADEAAHLMSSAVPRRTGRLARSFRRKSATQRKATVVAHYTAYFIDAGTKDHVIKPRRSRGLIFQAGGRTIFTKKVNHPATRAQPFRERAAREALRRHSILDALIKNWNKAA